MRLRRMAPPLAAVALLLSLAATGCAERNGSVAAFCKQLPQTQSVSGLVNLARQGDTAATATHIRAVAAGIRKLERAAPRTIRPDVATTANFAERLADALRGVESEPIPTSTTSVGTAVTLPPGATSTTLNPSDLGATVGDPYSYDFGPGFYADPRVRAVQQVLWRYPGALRATAAFVSYSADHCGEGVVPKGYNGPEDTGGPMFPLN